MYCSNCGAEIRTTSKFCGKCGAANTETEESPELSSDLVLDAINSQKDINVLENSEKEESSQEINITNSQTPESNSSKKEVFIAAIKAAMIKGEIKDPSIVDRRNSGKNNNYIQLCNADGKILSQVSMIRVQEIINSPKAVLNQDEWDTEISNAWEGKSSRTTNKLHKKDEVIINGFLSRVIITASIVISSAFISKYLVADIYYILEAFGLSGPFSKQLAYMISILIPTAIISGFLFAIAIGVMGFVRSLFSSRRN